MSISSLFVGDLALFTSEMEIVSHFAQYGYRLHAVKIIRDKSHSLNYGFVELENDECARRALVEMDQTYLCGRRLKVRKAEYNVKAHHQHEKLVNSIHVRFKSLKAGVFVTEDSLFQMFSHYGTVTDVVVKFSSNCDVTGIQSGYGFVHFESSARGVEVALLTLHTFSRSVVVGSVEYVCEMSKNLKETLRNPPSAEHFVDDGSLSSRGNGGVSQLYHPQYHQSRPAAAPVEHVQYMPRPEVLPPNHSDSRVNEVSAEPFLTTKKSFREFLVSANPLPQTVLPLSALSGRSRPHGAPRAVLSQADPYISKHAIDSPNSIDQLSDGGDYVDSRWFPTSLRNPAQSPRAAVAPVPRAVVPVSTRAPAEYMPFGAPGRRMSGNSPRTPLMDTIFTYSREGEVDGAGCEQNYF